jgi:hypothetical protein
MTAISATIFDPESRYRQSGFEERAEENFPDEFGFVSANEAVELERPAWSQAMKQTFRLRTRSHRALRLRGRPKSGGGKRMRLVRLKIQIQIELHPVFREPVVGFVRI